MCGLVGFYTPWATQKDLETVKKVLLESRIRGMHASGIAWYDGKGINEYIKPVPIDKLLQDFDLSETLYDGESVSLIGHIRYSTSNLLYNQPIATNKWAIAHNGVITQSHPKSWLERYGYQCEGKNDSELLLRSIESGSNPFEDFPQSSIAAVILEPTGVVRGIRNGKRPLWKGKIGQGRVYASTYDILHRAGVEFISKVNPVDYELQQRSCYNDLS